FLNSWPSCDPGQARRPWYRQERLRRSGESWFSFPDLLSLLISCELSVDERLPFEFEAALAATVVERGVFGARLHYFAETGSTNDLASAAAERGEREGTTFVAGSQTAGRGRRGRHPRREWTAGADQVAERHRLGQRRGIPRAAQDRRHPRRSLVRDRRRAARDPGDRHQHRSGLVSA